MKMERTQKEYFEEFDDIINKLINEKGHNLYGCDLGCGAGNTLILLKTKFQLTNLKGCEIETSEDKLYIPQYLSNDLKRKIYTNCEGFKSAYDLTEEARNSVFYASKEDIQLGVNILDFLDNEEKSFDLIILNKALQYNSYADQTKIINNAIKKLNKSGLFYICHHTKGTDFPVNPKTIIEILNKTGFKYQCFNSYLRSRVRNVTYHHFLWKE